MVAQIFILTARFSCTSRLMNCSFRLKRSQLFYFLTYLSSRKECREALCFGTMWARVRSVGYEEADGCFGHTIPTRHPASSSACQQLQTLSLFLTCFQKMINLTHFGQRIKGRTPQSRHPRVPRPPPPVPPGTDWRDPCKIQTGCGASDLASKMRHRVGYVT